MRETNSGIEVKNRRKILKVFKACFLGFYLFIYLFYFIFYSLFFKTSILFI